MVPDMRASSEGLGEQSNDSVSARLKTLDRSRCRQALGISGQPVFFGADLWTAYELCWLGPRGKPELAIAQFIFPCESRHLVERQSLAACLDQLAERRFADAAHVRGALQKELSRAVWTGGPAGSAVGVRLLASEDFAAQRLAEMDGLCLDRLDLSCDIEQEPDAGLLRAAFEDQPVQETLMSRLLQIVAPHGGGRCPGSLQITYSGPQIEQAGLLRYLLAYRRFSGLQEQCTERIFMDIWKRCRPDVLIVHARFGRRDGLEINPWRTSHPGPLPDGRRTARQ